MLEATLGPGLLSSSYDGLQNDLTSMTGVFLKKGEYTRPLDEEKKWDFTPLAKPGDKVEAADWLGEVREGWLPHKIMVRSPSRVNIPSSPWLLQGNTQSTGPWLSSLMPTERSTR